MAHREAGLTLRLARILAPVTVLGPGRRVAVWVQGCAIACPGCASVDTWDPAGGEAVPVDEVCKLLADQIGELSLDGLTITGGEPTSQPEALAELVTSLRARLGPRPLDVLLFTGRTHPAATRVAPALLALADCVVAGPYRRELPGEGRLVASGNQTVSYGSAAARRRYEDWNAADGARLQVTAEQGDLLLVGLPEPGDLSEFESRLRERGVGLGEVSWRA
ncbi:4Fe-4S single cluster domain-containing protein [Kribbella sp. NPDC051718]|uniref:4Fe-4S single cluster domain-containing protein n=1 Tax=Kribbella sp. NPDC051718 TaxID=3155168 RepID=UPI00343CB520